MNRLQLLKPSGLNKACYGMTLFLTTKLRCEGETTQSLGLQTGMVPQDFWFQDFFADRKFVGNYL